jgi:hypothetical protein
LQQVLRAGGYAVRVNGLWDAPTRTAWWRRTQAEALELPAVGSGTRWLTNAAAPLNAEIMRCLGGSSLDYATGFQAVVGLVADVESTGKLETEGSGGVPWIWVAAGAAVVLVGVVSVALWRQGRRQAAPMGWLPSRRPQGG